METNKENLGFGTQHSDPGLSVNSETQLTLYSIFIYFKLFFLTRDLTIRRAHLIDNLLKLTFCEPSFTQFFNLLLIWDILAFFYLLITRLIFLVLRNQVNDSIGILYGILHCLLSLSRLRLCSRKTIAESSYISLDQILDTLGYLNLFTVIFKHTDLFLKVFDRINWVGKLKPALLLLFEDMWTNIELLCCSLNCSHLIVFETWSLGQGCIRLHILALQRLVIIESLLKFIFLLFKSNLWVEIDCLRILYFSCFVFKLS